MRNKLLEIINEIKSTFGEAILEVGEFRGQTFIIIKLKEVIKELVKFLKERGFNHLQTLTAVDYLKLGKTPRFEVVYQFYNLSDRIALRLRVQVPEEDPSIESITDLFPGANFLEREVFDLLGIAFKGHPNLKRILLPENWKGHPLRKDYPLEPKEKPEDFIKLKEWRMRLEEYGIK
ncbi:MAG: NADH-quinone oxidoreductase subunit C [Caldimicrobium sp.]